MKNIYLYIVLVLFVPCFSTCQLLKIGETIEEIPTSIKDESRGITREMVIGIFEGLNTEQTSNNLDDATRKLLDEVIETINFELSRIDFGQLKVETIGDNLVLSLVETLEDNQEALGAAITGSLDQIDFSGLFENLSSEDQQEALSKLLGSIFSAESGNGQKLGQMMNTAIQQIDLAPLGKQIEENIDLNASLAESFDKLLEVTYEIGEIRSLVSRSQRSLPLTLFYWFIFFSCVILAFFLAQRFLGRRTSRRILRQAENFDDETFENLINDLITLQTQRNYNRA